MTIWIAAAGKPASTNENTLQGMTLQGVWDHRADPLHAAGF